VRKTIEKEEIKQLPPLKFEGPVSLCSSEKSAFEAFEVVLKESVVGFDTESRPSFKKGVRYPLSLLQLATINEVFIIRLQKVDIAERLTAFFEDTNITKVGIGIRDDIRELRNLANFESNNIIDLNEWAPDLGFEKIGARNLSAMILRGRISKQQQTSNWAVEDLSPAQIEYAATDAWICTAIYNRLVSSGYQY
jgi:ribonuclease D